MDITRVAPRPRTTATLVAALLTAGCTDLAESDFDTGPRRQPTWSAQLPDGLGKPLLAQVAGDAVVVQAEDGAAVFARSDGAVRWQRRSAVPSEIAGIAGNTLVVGYADRLELIDLATGTERARIHRESSLSQRVTATGVYVVDASDVNRSIVAYDLAGNRRWQQDFTHGVDWRCPARSGSPHRSPPSPTGDHCWSRHGRARRTHCR